LRILEALIPCMIFSSTSYEQEFPSLDKKTDPVTKVSTKPHIISHKKKTRTKKRTYKIKYLFPRVS